MEKIKIGAVFNVIRNGASISQTPGKSGIPITRIETILDNRLDFSRVGFADVFDNQYEDYYLADGDILMSHINSVTHLGKVGLVEGIDTDVIHGMNLLLLKANPHQAFSKYLYYFFTTSEFKRKLIPITKKSVNQASFNISDLKEIEIPLPSYADQIRIAHLLEKIESLIAERKRSIELLEELVKAAFYQLFGDPVRNEKRWRNEELKNIVAKDCVLSYGIVQPGEDFPNGIPVVRPIDLKDSFVGKNGLKLIDPKISKKFKRTILKGGEILFCVRGTTGIVSIAKDELKGANVTRGITPIFFDEEVNTIYIFHLLRTSQIQKIIADNTYGSALKQINLSELRTLNLVIPPLDLQNKFATTAQKIEALKSEQQAQVQVMEELYAAITQKAFTGGLDLSKIPVDEVLLFKEAAPKANETKYFEKDVVNNILNIYLEIKGYYNDFDTLKNASSKFGKAFAKWNAALKAFNLEAPLPKGLQILISDIGEIRASLRQLYISELPNSEKLAWEEIGKEVLLKADEGKNFKKGAVTDVVNIFLEIKDYYNNLDDLKNASSKFEKTFARWDAAVKTVNLEGSLPEDLQILVSDIEEIRASLKQLQVSELPKAEKLTWNAISFERVAALINAHFEEHYFNIEMLLRYLEEDLGIQVHYFTSAEQKKNQQYEQADDFLSFVSGALTGQNTFLQLEQVFYNAETENIPGISFNQTDLENLASKIKKERSGIYFRIKDETTPG